MIFGISPQVNEVLRQLLTTVHRKDPLHRELIQIDARGKYVEIMHTQPATNRFALAKSPQVYVSSIPIGLSDEIDSLYNIEQKENLFLALQQYLSERTNGGKGDTVLLTSMLLFPYVPEVLEPKLQFNKITHIVQKSVGPSMRDHSKIIIDLRYEMAILNKFELLKQYSSFMEMQRPIYPLLLTQIRAGAMELREDDVIRLYIDDIDLIRGEKYTKALPPTPSVSTGPMHKRVDVDSLNLSVAPFNL